MSNKSSDSICRYDYIDDTEYEQQLFDEVMIKEMEDREHEKNMLEQYKMDNNVTIVKKEYEELKAQQQKEASENLKEFAKVYNEMAEQENDDYRDSSCCDFDNDPDFDNHSETLVPIMRDQHKIKPSCCHDHHKLTSNNGDGVRHFELRQTGSAICDDIKELKKLVDAEQTTIYVSDCMCGSGLYYIPYVVKCIDVNMESIMMVCGKIIDATKFNWIAPGKGTVLEYVGVC